MPGAFTLVEPAEADLALVDIDCGEGQHELRRLAAQEGDRPLLVTVGEEEPVETFDGFLKKPLRASAALALLARVEERLRAREAAATEAGGDAAGSRLSRYSPDEYLQGHLEEAARTSLREGCPLRLGCDQLSPVFLPRSRLVMQKCSDSQLQLHLRTKVEGRGVEVVHLDEREDWLRATEPGTEVPMESFLWKVGLWTGRGRLPENADPRAPLILIGWPNCTRVILPEQVMPIAAFWAQQPASVLETADLLRLPVQVVVNVHNAMAALGLLREGKRRADRLVAPAAPKVDRARGGLLKRMLEKLGAADDTQATRRAGT